ncbi:hypothetical protein FRC04_000642 [Tulasnella sp. 424]|nr:hypothetical protein FRC04_000642 [Tulasnella sp. 424]KAG8974911.1 hypothetical protein FRC05_006588 [Tulasnella sp. 425]
MAGITGVGGVIGFLRTGSIPSLVAGGGVSALYVWSTYHMLHGDPEKGLQGAFAASAILSASSLPRVRKGPVPLVLAIAGASTALYYGKQLKELRIFPFN